MADVQLQTLGEQRGVRRWQSLVFPGLVGALLVGWFVLAALPSPGGGPAPTGDGAAAADAPVPGAVSAFASIPPRVPDCSAGSVALTFDDGPDPQITPAVLDVLRAWQATATFYVIGEQAAARPDLLRRATSEGHTVGNHTWSHPDLTGLAGEAVRDELVRTSDVITAATGRPPQVWRPPFGSHDAAVEAEADALGLRMQLWSDGTDGRDWQGATARAIAERVVGNAEDGSVVLLHDIHQTTLDALPLVLEGLHAKGLCAR
ncbi:MAG: polysaccharide deacetylase family protein [Candidatus Nanopelagicales bacterium]|jgi:peptidoglycan/xylan/chitin deacetylase (PgdA/CDA1 family)|nr:polysaccharide deacetylase family protein [Candidatus Nanopelagicales bacterium]